MEREVERVRRLRNELDLLKKLIYSDLQLSLRDIESTITQIAH